MQKNVLPRFGMLEQHACCHRDVTVCLTSLSMQIEFKSAPHANAYAHVHVHWAHQIDSLAYTLGYLYMHAEITIRIRLTLLNLAINTMRNLSCNFLNRNNHKHLQLGQFHVVVFVVCLFLRVIYFLWQNHMHTVNSAFRK